MYPAPPSSIHLHPAPPRSTQFHPVTSTSTELIVTSTQLHPPPFSSFQPPPSSLQQSQQYLNQNIERNWALSPNLGRTIKSCPFWLKIGTHGILTMLILIPTLVFWISGPKSIFGQMWAKKVKVVQFGWKLAHRASRRCWFLFQHYFSQFPTLNPFLDKFGPKNSKLFILTKN